MHKFCGFMRFVFRCNIMTQYECIDLTFRLVDKWELFLSREFEYNDLPPLQFNQ